MVAIAVNRSSGILTPAAVHSWWALIGLITVTAQFKAPGLNITAIGVTGLGGPSGNHITLVTPSK